ncbi:hypothetical protein Hdeb2414_s0212g00834711 [Helianthus debilis subsp. tardiflorus]
MIEELSDRFLATPTDTVESVAGQEDDWEDGEFRGGENDGKKSKACHMETQSSESMHAQHANQEDASPFSAEGKHEALEKVINDDIGGTQPHTMKAGNAQENYVVEPNIELGQGPGTKSRKRPRRFRSSEGELEGDPHMSYVRNLERSFYLNFSASIGVQNNTSDQPPM